MPRAIYHGVHDFATLREGGYFYVDKTDFIREWWKGSAGPDKVSLITRPRRFGKTLMMSTVEQFFSTDYAGRSDLFKGLDVWKDQEMRSQQGTWPVIFLSLSSVKGNDFATLRHNLCRQIANLFTRFRKLKASDALDPEDRARFSAIQTGMGNDFEGDALFFLCDLLYRVHGKKAIVLLDEYDTPMHEAWINNCWKDLAGLLRNLFHATFKDNMYLERAILTGITRVSKESMFSDLNNLGVYSISTPRYSTAFGFTETEVFAAMDEYGLKDRDSVRAMYDGYAFGTVSDIYNPWSICCYLKDPRLLTWWSNTGSNALAGKLIQEGSPELKQDFMTLLEGGSISSEIDEQIIFDQLDDERAIWSLLLASGYLKIDCPVPETGIYSLSLTNGEVRKIMAALVSGWFKKARSDYGKFIKALLQGDLKYMNRFMNNVAINCFSSFDTGTRPSQTEPERFYHGFVLGLLVDLRDRYILTSNRESGYGRYDVMLEPRKPVEDPAFIIEFKVLDPDDEKDITATVAAALAQIREKGYEQQLVERGVPAVNIRKYGFAFQGKKVLIG